jgi:hypothetical protein
LGEATVPLLKYRARPHFVSFDKIGAMSLLYLPIPYGGASVLVNGAVFKTVSETARAGSGRFDSYTPPPIFFRAACSPTVFPA